MSSQSYGMRIVHLLGRSKSTAVPLTRPAKMRASSSPNLNRDFSHLSSARSVQVAPKAAAPPHLNEGASDKSARTVSAAAAAAAAKIIAAGERCRKPIDSELPKLTGLAAEIIAAGERRRETGK